MDEIVFDGAAISRADREFLASLDDHPLKRNPLYGTPCPLQPDFGAFDPEDKDQDAERYKFFATVVDWMLANYAYYKGAFIGKGGVISLVDGEITSVASLRGLMQPYALVSIGKRDGIEDDISRRCLDDACPAGADRCGANLFRSVAADIHRRGPPHLQPLPAAGTSH